MVDIKELKTYNKVKQGDQYIFEEDNLQVSCTQYTPEKINGTILIGTTEGNVDINQEDIPPVTKEVLEDNGIDLKIPDIAAQSTEVYDSNGIELFDSLGIQLRILN